MNRVYKVIYSKARQCAMVVSELARSSHKNSRKGAGHVGTPALARMVAAVLAAGALTWGIVPGVSWAADTASGKGDGVAIGTGSNAPKAENVAIGKGATISYSNGASSATGDIVVGNGANINNYASQGGSIAIGKNAKIENMAGGGEASFAFGQTTFSGGWWSSSRIPADPSKVVGSIAIGDNTFARTGSTMIGSHNYKGELGDTTVDSASTRTDALNVYATTIGANSFSNGAFTTSTGAYNIISSDYNGGRLANPVKNMGATITGALNSIESKKEADYYSGIANSIVGTANRTSNSNGSLIFGAGNEIKNSITDISAPTSGGDSAKALQDSLMEAVQNSKSGGATLVIGGGNKANYTQKTQILGVANTITGTESHIAMYNMVDGYQNTVTEASHVKVLGQNVTINQGADSNTVIGDYRTVAEKQSNNVIIGNADEKNPITTEKKETVILGYNANAKVDGGVAIGSGSIADIGAGVFGWDPGTNQASTTDSKVWKSSWAAVSVGDGTHTRQITNLAAGFNDTDAVNVAQLKAAMENAAPKIDFVAGDGIQIEKDSTGTRYTIRANITGGKTDTDTTTVKSEEGSSSGTGSSGTSGSGKALEITTETNPIYFADDEGTAAKVKPSEKERLGILGDKTNISTKVDGSNITVSLKKDITVDSMKAGNTTVNNEGVTIAGGPSMTMNGIDAGEKKITNVAAGTESSDAVNYGQLQNVENQVTSNTQNINYLNGRVGELGDRINKVGAGAAALAALHPLDFDPDDKWDFAAGVGNYRNATAAAVGLFYRPNERTMFNLGWTMGDNRNMVNGGFSVKFGKSNKYVKYSKAEMASVIDNQSREIAELKAKDAQNAKYNAEMRAEIEALKKQVEALAVKK